MARFARSYAADQWPSKQVQVANQVKDLVPREFVAKAQNGVHDLLVVHQDKIIKPPAACQAHLGQLMELAHEAEGSRRRDLASVRFGRGQLEPHVLAADLAFRVGPAPAPQSYPDQAPIPEAARPSAAGSTGRAVMMTVGRGGAAGAG